MNFHGGKEGSQSKIMDYKDYSLECEANQTDCVKKGSKEGSPFLRSINKEQKGYLTETFKISDRKELEILFVVDVSESMDDNLKNTGKNMLSLLSYIQDKNWRMAFTTADHGDHDQSKQGTPDRWESYTGDDPRFGKFMRLERNGEVLQQFILNRDTPRYETVFQDTLTRQDPSDCERPPFCQSHNEQPLRSLLSAVSRYKTDKKARQFFKPGVDTVVIIATDEDERSEDFRRATTAEKVIQTYKNVFKGQGKRLFGFSISIQDEQCYREEKRAGLFGSKASYGHIVGRLAELTGGKNISLCSEDYGSVLAEISKITRALMQSLTLSEMFYIPETVKVSLIPEQPNVSWKLYGRKLIFSEDIVPNTEVTVSYRYER